jgi:hypothetical protein
MTLMDKINTTKAACRYLTWFIGFYMHVPFLRSAGIGWMGSSESDGPATCLKANGSTSKQLYAQRRDIPRVINLVLVDGAARAHLHL